MNTKDLDKTAFAFMTLRPDPKDTDDVIDVEAEDHIEEHTSTDEAEESSVEESDSEDFSVDNDPLLNQYDEDEEDEDLDAFDRLEKELSSRGDSNKPSDEEDNSDSSLLGESDKAAKVDKADDSSTSEDKSTKDETSEEPEDGASKEVFESILNETERREASPTNTSKDEYDYGISAEDEAFVEQLPFEDQEILSVWKHAEKKDPKRYTGKFREHVEFLKKHRDFVKEALNSGEFDSEEDVLRSDEYETFSRENAPRVAQSEFKRAEKDFVYDEAARRAEEKMNPIKAELEALKLKPKVEQQANKFQESLGEFLPEPVLKVLRETPGQEGLKKLQEEHPVEAAVSSRIFSETAELGKELLRLHSGVSKVDTTNNPLHAKLGETIIRFSDDMLSLPEESRRKDGKDFMPRDKLVSMPESERTKYWTFSNSDILKLLATDMQLRINQEISATIAQQEATERQIFAKYGVTLDELKAKRSSSVTQNSDTKVTAKKESSSPRVRPKPTGGAVDAKVDELGSFFTTPLSR